MLAIQHNLELYYQDYCIRKSLALYDSVTDVVLKTIEIYRPKISASASVMMKASYLPDLTELLLSETRPLTGKIKEEYLSRISKYLKIVNHQDSVLGFCSSKVFEKLTNYTLAKYAFTKSLKVEDVFWPTHFKKEFYDVLVRDIPNGPFKLKLLARYLLEGLDRYPYNVEIARSLKEFVSMYSETSYDPFYSKVKTMHEEAMSIRAKGAPAFEFALKDSVGIIRKMSDFKGKVVLIDFTFTGCGGCMLITPYLKKLEHEFRNDSNIVFISIYTDKDFEIFKKSAKAGIYSAPESLHLYTNGDGFYVPLIFHYNIVGAPTLVLIDAEGKLVASRAPDPRLDEGKALEELIKQTAASINKK